MGRGNGVRGSMLVFDRELTSIGTDDVASDEGRDDGTFDR